MSNDTMVELITRPVSDFLYYSTMYIMHTRIDLRSDTTVTKCHDGRKGGRGAAQGQRL